MSVHAILFCYYIIARREGFRATDAIEWARNMKALDDNCADER